MTSISLPSSVRSEAPANHGFRQLGQNLKELARKVVDFIKNYWGVLLLAAAALAVTAAFSPVIGLTVLSIVGFGAIGFALGFATSAFSTFGGHERSYVEQFRRLSTGSQIILGIVGFIFLAPIAPAIGGFMLGNHVFHKL